MQIATSADHAGFPLQERVKEFLTQAGHDVIDMGRHDTTPVDYPDSVEVRASVLLEGRAERGIAIGGSGALTPRTRASSTTT